MVLNNAADTLNANLTFNGNITFSALGSVSFLGGFTINTAATINVTTTGNLDVTANNYTLHAILDGALISQLGMQVESVDGALTLSAGTTGSLTTNDALTINGVFSTTVTTTGALVLQSTGATFALSAFTTGSVISTAALTLGSSSNNVNINATLGQINGNAQNINLNATQNVSIGVPAASITISQSEEAIAISSESTIDLICADLLYIYSTGNNVALEGVIVQVEGTTFNISSSLFTITPTLPSAGSASATGAFVPSTVTQRFLVWDSADSNVKLYAGN
jgi:hypothetical protein